MARGYVPDAFKDAPETYERLLALKRSILTISLDDFQLVDPDSRTKMVEGSRAFREARRAWTEHRDEARLMTESEAALRAVEKAYRDATPLVQSVARERRRLGLPVRSAPGLMLMQMWFQSDMTIPQSWVRRGHRVAFEAARWNHMMYKTEVTGTVRVFRPGPKKTVRMTYCVMDRHGIHELQPEAKVWYLS